MQSKETVTHSFTIKFISIYIDLGVHVTWVNIQDYMHISACTCLLKTDSTTMPTYGATSLILKALEFVKKISVAKFISMKDRILHYFIICKVL